ncbi:hypothetical protein [Enterovibrio norvegicus]|uniref:hypothetical protein n=1 Tax=Enterovibrio norvegicus TaxID=188144 RepID=UPI000C86222D|nr:hypothetical protein [Enterovibrio norvegicus]PMN64306.1 hypothetical protein BCT27_10095 [Enterovibrio norvegicus]
MNDLSTEEKKRERLFKKSVAGVGYIGEGEYSKKDHHYIYHRWAAMLHCGHDKTYQNYNGHLVTPDWHCFNTFAVWYVEQCRKLGINPNTKNTCYVLNCTLGSFRGHELHSPYNTQLLPKSAQMTAVKNDLRCVPDLDLFA